MHKRGAFLPSFFLSPRRFRVFLSESEKKGEIPRPLECFVENLGDRKKGRKRHQHMSRRILGMELQHQPRQNLSLLRSFFDTL